MRAMITPWGKRWRGDLRCPTLRNATKVSLVWCTESASRQSSEGAIWHEAHLISLELVRGFLRQGTDQALEMPKMP